MSCGESIEDPSPPLSATAGFVTDRKITATAVDKIIVLFDFIVNSSDLRKTIIMAQYYLKVIVSK